jgi:dienelactone hydrolase
MRKKCPILILLILVMSAQFSFADNVTFNSKQEGLELTGILTKPEGDGPFPAVVLLHGCSGLDETNKRDNAWINRLVKWGYASFQVDSFRPRDISTICNNWNLIIGMIGKRTQDAYEAKSYLAKLPFVDSNRIAVMGWSHGGTTILNTITRSVADNRPFNAAVAFYPFCYESLSQLKSPVQILIGEKDDWCPADYCTNFMPSGNTDHEAILKIYPGAYHDFDYEGLYEIYEGHKLRYDPIAAQDSIVQVKSFLTKHLK